MGVQREEVFDNGISEGSSSDLYLLRLSNVYILLLKSYITKKQAEGRMSSVIDWGRDPSSEMAINYERLKQLFLSKVDVDFVRQYADLLQQRIRRAQQSLRVEVRVQGVGRGGNNVAQNLKKCLMTLLKRHLQGHVWRQFQEECIAAHRVKSQKENIIILYLYLQKYMQEGLVTLGEVQAIHSSMRGKILKYIGNSRVKMEGEPARRDFHLRNIDQFEKYLGFDLNFSRQRTFNQLEEMMRGLYRKKKSEYAKGIRRIRCIITNEPYFTALFPDLHPTAPQEEECDFYFNDKH